MSKELLTSVNNTCNPLNIKYLVTRKPLILYCLRVECHIISPPSKKDNHDCFFHMNFSNLLVKGYKLPHKLSIERDDVLRYGDVSVTQQVKRKLVKISKIIKFTPKLSLAKCHIDYIRLPNSWVAHISRRFANSASLELQRGQATKQQIKKFIIWLKHSQRLKSFTYFSTGDHVITSTNLKDLNAAYGQLCYTLKKIRIEKCIVSDACLNKAFVKGLANFEKYMPSLREFKICVVFNHSIWTYNFEEVRNHPFIYRKFYFSCGNLVYAWDAKTLDTNNHKIYNFKTKRNSKKTISRLFKLIEMLEEISQGNNQFVFDRYNVPKLYHLASSSLSPYNNKLIHHKMQMTVKEEPNYDQAFNKEVYKKYFSFFSEIQNVEINAVIHDQASLFNFLDEAKNVESLEFHVSVPAMLIDTSLRVFTIFFDHIARLQKLKKFELQLYNNETRKIMMEDLKDPENNYSSNEPTKVNDNKDHPVIKSVFEKSQSIPELKINMKCLNIQMIYFNPGKVDSSSTFSFEELLFSPKILYIAEVFQCYIEKNSLQKIERASWSKSFKRLKNLFALPTSGGSDKFFDVVVLLTIEEPAAALFFTLVKDFLATQLKNFNLEFSFLKCTNSTKLGTLQILNPKLL